VKGKERILRCKKKVRDGEEKLDIEGNVNRKKTHPHSLQAGETPLRVKMFPDGYWGGGVGRGSYLDHRRGRKGCSTYPSDPSSGERGEKWHSIRIRDITGGEKVRRLALRVLQKIRGKYFSTGTDFS